jgi:alginate O-acetyltransferase complex protein AlgJ
MRASFWLNGVAMIAVLAGGGLMSGWTFFSSDVRSTILKPLPGYSYLNGYITSTLEATYKNELPIRNNSVEVLNAFTLATFGEGRKGVVVGNKGWLFTSEEYAWTPDSPTILKRNLDRIATIAAELKAKGIALQIALVPEKADIYSDLLARPRPAEHKDEYDSVRRQLAAMTGAPVPDLRRPMLAEKARTDVFFPTDTHWTVAGAGVVAKELAASFPAFDLIPATSFELEPEQPEHHSGDLLRFLELGPFHTLLSTTNDGVTPVLAVAKTVEIGDFLADEDDAAAADPQIALVGTSYSANKLWSFEAQLKAALNRDLVNFAEEGHGPMVPMESLLKKIEAGEVKVRAIIWEMPLRYLDDNLEAPASASAV